MAKISQMLEKLVETILKHFPSIKFDFFSIKNGTPFLEATPKFYSFFNLIKTIIIYVV